MLNLSALKNVLLGTPPESLPSSPASTDDAVAGKVRLKQKELLRGRTHAKVEAISADLDAARLAYKQMERTVGERIAEGLDATVQIQEMSQAGDRVRGLESALGIAIEKDEAAQCAIADEKRDAEIEADEAVVAAFMGAVLKVETLLGGEFKRVAEEVGATHTAVGARCQGDTQTMHQLARFLGYYPTYLIRANAALIVEGRRYIQDIDRDGITLSMQAEQIRVEMTRVSRHR